MKTILAILAIIGAVAAFTIPQVKLERKEMPTGIINGTDESIRDFNFLAAINRNIIGGRPILSGSGVILNPNWILTAANTVNGLVKENTGVRVGSSYGSAGGLEVKVSKIIVHPGYNQLTRENDVALLRLENTLTLSGDVNLAALSLTQPKVNTTAVVPGYGLSLTSILPILRSAKVKIDGVEKKESKNTRVIRTRDTWGGGPTAYDWGSPLIVDGETVGLYIGDLNLPSARNSTTTDNFVDLTQPQLIRWISENTLL